MDLINEMRERMRLAIDADGGNRIKAIQDLKFSHGEQWPAEARLARQQEKRPCLTVNKTDSFVRSVVNNMRSQRPRIRVHPIADGADVKKADIIEGLCRHIEVNSAADLAYDTAADYQVRCGFGFWRINSRYVSEDSFDQELYIDRIRNPFTVYFDPSSTMPDGSDAEWCVITSGMRKSEFKRKYPKAKIAEVDDLGPGDDKAVWASKEEVVVGEYYRFEEVDDTLCLMSNGSKVFKSKLPSAEILGAMGIKIIDTRPSVRKQLKWSLNSALEELDKRDLPGKYIPVIPVYGAELVIDGKVERFGMVRQLIDPQRMYNYWRTQETEYAGIAPLAPWLMAEGQDEGHEEEWKNANRKAYSRLIYKPIFDDEGNPLPPPQRLQPSQIPAATVNAAMAASEDLKAVAGMFDPALGAPGQETSGAMVIARQGQSDMSNYHFYDNLCRSIRQTGIVLLDLIPHYYDTQRVVRILGVDGVPQTTTINQKVRDQLGNIVQVLHDVTVGTYDVVMDTGPGYQTKRQENTETLLGLLRELPQVGQVAGDIVVRQMDFEASTDVADRLAAANPIAMAEKQLPQDLPDDVKAYIAHMQGAMQQLQTAYQQLEMEKKAKVWGDAQWIQLEKYKIDKQEDGENKRLLAKEHAENTRTAITEHTRMHEANERISEDRFEALLDAHTDIKLHQDRPPHNEVIQHR